jgi:hypothetical protein
MFIIICAFQFSPVDAQLVYYQDTFRGGVTGGGFSPGFSDFPGEIELYIEPGSTVRRAFLFVTKYFDPESDNLTLNGQTIYLQDNEFESNSFISVSSFGEPRTVAVVAHDITDYVPNLSGTLSFSITPPPALPANMNRYSENYVLIAYDNDNMPEVNCLAIINDMSSAATMNYNIENLNAIDEESPAGFAVHGGHMCNIVHDGSYVYIDNQLVGLIGGKDVNNLSSCTGSTGTFYYQNNELYGLSDDTANVTMHGPDALANISPYIANSTELEVRFDYQLETPPNGPQTNPIWQMFFAYTSTCEAFETTLTERVTMCANVSSVQLEATGGVSYDWWPADNLSCTDCPNPVFTGTQSANYHVQIWNNDSCSKILPVRIDVVDTPHSANLSTNPATCGGAGGELIIGSISGGQSAYQYSLGNAWTGNPTANIFSNLPAGDYTFFVRDQNLCMYTQDFTIEEISTAQAAFTSNPQSGTEPLTVQFNNQSSGSTDYQWSAGDSISTSFNFNYTFDTAGSYPVQLISWYKEPQCADTAMATIIVNPAPPDYSHSIFIPTLYNLEIGDFFIETTNVQRVEFEIYNAIGQHIFSTTQDVADGRNDLWDGSRHARGYYFFRLKYWDVQGVEFRERGKVLVVR